MEKGKRSFQRVLYMLGLIFWLATGVAQAELDGVVNINTASLEELQRLPGIGEARALAILELREQQGGFTSFEELLKIRGIGEVSLEKLRPYLVLQGETTAEES